jgi:hypothetical protein
MAMHSVDDSRHSMLQDTFPSTHPPSIISSHLDDHALTLDAVKDARVINRHILFGDDLDDLL